MNERRFACVDENNNHRHEYYEPILSTPAGWNIDLVVHWCPCCGMIVVDEMSDNRLYKAGKMYFPTYECITPEEEQADE